MSQHDTQAYTQATQHKTDPRRLGGNGSGLNDDDVSDVICILHPSSPAAFRIVKHTAKANAQHVLQNHGLAQWRHNQYDESFTEMETILIEPVPENHALDLALRFSSKVCDPAVGFCFGRHPMKCDINLDHENKQKRVSNTHFRIFINGQGVLMVEDLSTNGTIVDRTILGGKRRTRNGTTQTSPNTRTLDHGSIIEIMSDDAENYIKFILNIPPREGFEKAYTAKFNAYMEHKTVAEERARAAEEGPPIPDGAARGLLAAPLAGPPNPKTIPAMRPPNLNSDYGMHWGGGEKYKCTGVLGKGAFATVYQLATRMHGELFAAKELEKKRVMKNGVLDQRIDNEMKIMQQLRHEHIVQYVDYVETEEHLYIIMEFVPCGDLQGYMSAHGTLPEHFARTMTSQILQALAYLHQQNVTHRDIKPDNILICSEDPFVVKLTDFGLSKVVKSNDTFLKTFCGTLLYCAPEVFPHYDSYTGAHRQKRRRHGSGTQSDQRSYSQLVDIWSYAAVLWFVLCGKPPFEGVVDGNGKGMFNRIMETPLVTAPLRDHGISDECTDLLLQMLTTDPMARPDEAACLAHPWLRESSHVANTTVSQSHNQVLASIAEGEEELDASQLSIKDRELPADDQDSDSRKFKDSTERKDVKRQKGASFLEHRARSGFHSSSEDDSMGSIPLINDIYDDRTQSIPASKNHRLFGEISQAALRSSGLLGDYENIDGTSETQLGDFGTENHGEEHTNAEGNIGDTDEQSSSAPLPATNVGPPRPVRANASWRESMVRELNMIGSDADDSAVHQSSEPSTPIKSNTEGQTNTDEVAADVQDDPNEVTPRPKQTNFHRSINIPLPPSFFYDPNDPSTHNYEYASRVSGIDFLNNPNRAALQNLQGLAAASAQTFTNDDPTIISNGSNPNKENEHTDPSAPNLDELALDSKVNAAESSISNAAIQASEFLKPPRVLGKLTSTPGSFVNLTLNLTQRTTTWGRNPANTIVYRDSQDTRVSKVALEIYFHRKNAGKGLGSINDEDDGTKDEEHLDDLCVFVATQSHRGITVNGVPMHERDDKGHKCFGRLYTGDEICVSQIAGVNGERLKFLCEFFVGKGRKARREGRSRFAIETAETEADSGQSGTEE